MCLPPLRPFGERLRRTARHHHHRHGRVPDDPRSSGPAVLDPTANRSPSAHPISSIAPAQSVP
ncbi:hypothetical protein [Pseudonocardia sp.]|uniref:hypothetical protein n=1 Tax=Pseudonocardia sp. TaxID=60912 RepID=UPI0031FBC539